MVNNDSSLESSNDITLAITGIFYLLVVERDVGAAAAFRPASKFNVDPGTSQPA